MMQTKPTPRRQAAKSSSSKSTTAQQQQQVTTSRQSKDSQAHHHQPYRPHQLQQPLPLQLHQDQTPHNVHEDYMNHESHAPSHSHAQGAATHEPAGHSHRGEALVHSIGIRVTGNQCCGDDPVRAFIGSATDVQTSDPVESAVLNTIRSVLGGQFLSVLGLCLGSCFFDRSCKSALSARPSRGIRRVWLSLTSNMAGCCL